MRIQKVNIKTLYCLNKIFVVVLNMQPLLTHSWIFCGITEVKYLNRLLSVVAFFFFFFWIINDFRPVAFSFNVNLVFS